MILMIDNYDSFTWNLVQQIETLTTDPVEVIRNDVFDIDSVLGMGAKAIVISPGPGTPSKAGRIVDLIRANRSIPLLGVCLGHQAIGEAFGGRTVRGPEPVHGKTHEVAHEGRRLFEDCPLPLLATRYHSLVVERDSLPADLEVDAWTADGAIMAVSHRTLPVYGIQFHPESYGTSSGDLVMSNFLRLGGV